MTEQEMNQASKAYRDYREGCGYQDPVALDEIEGAYYLGMLKMKEQMMKEAMPRTVKFLDSVSYNHCIAHLGMNENDTVKIIIIKEN